MVANDVAAACDAARLDRAGDRTYVRDASRL